MKVKNNHTFLLIPKDLLPSDGPDTTRGSSLFGTRSSPATNTPGDVKAKKTAPSPRKSGANDSDSEATETESEWEKERAMKKAKGKLSQSAGGREEDDEKEKQRMLKWE